MFKALANSVDLVWVVGHLNTLRDDPTISEDEFETREKALGFTWSPYNLLGGPDVDPYLDVTQQFFAIGCICVCQQNLQSHISLSLGSCSR